MLIEIHELEVHPIDFEEQYGPGVIDFGPDLRQVDDLADLGTRPTGRGTPRQASDSKGYTAHRRAGYES